MRAKIDMTIHPADGGELISINPSTEEELARTPALSRDELDAVLQKAGSAARPWAAIPIKERQAFVAKLVDVISRDRWEIAEIIAREQGKPMTEALSAEVIATLSALKYLARKAEGFLKPRKAPHDLILFTSKSSYYQYDPYGVIAIISPWNFPFSVPMPQIAAAIVAGNTVVFKPAPGSILISKKMNDLFRAAGLPQGVVNTVFLQDKDASYLTQHPGVQKIVFTGSTAVGRKVMASAATQLTPVVLELGSKDPAVIAADANVERAARATVWGAFFSTGQVCVSVERVYVHKAVADRFIRACIRETEKLRCGDPMDPDTEVGPLSSRAQMEKALSHIRDAVAKGAKIIFGGKRIGERGYFVQPTILTDVDHSMLVMTEETFGPIMPIMVVDSIDEAIRLANDSIFGISAYGWTQSKKTARRLMRDLEAATVVINDGTFSWGEPNAPWGGVKKSGIGKTRAHFGLLEMVRVRYTSYEKRKKSDNFWWFPYNRRTRKDLDNAVDLFFSNNLFTKLKSAFSLLCSPAFLKTAPLASIVRNVAKLFK